MQVEAGAGAEAKFPDDAYVAAGASIGSAQAVWECDIVVKVDEPSPDEVGRLRAGGTVIARMAPGEHPELIAALVARNATGLSLDAIPRISRAQSMDVLSTMSNIAGYRGVIEAAESYGGMFSGQVTAAGKTQPAGVFVIGAGVAGLAAIGAATSLGARVRAFDVRPEVAEQIESMGAAFVTASGGMQRVSADGYAQALTHDQEAETARVYAKESSKADIIVTTALVRGQAPTTITADMVARHETGQRDRRPGRVRRRQLRTDRAGGEDRHRQRCDDHRLPGFHQPDAGAHVAAVRDEHRQPAQAADTGQGRRNSPSTWTTSCSARSRSPRRARSAGHHRRCRSRPRRRRPPVSQAPSATPDELAERAKRTQQRRYAWFGLAAVAVAAAITFSPASFLGNFTVFVLAVVVGFYVISNVSASLHTPLMAQTNAISGIILVGALLQLGSTNVVVVVLAFVAATVASINIFGGFGVAGRMISMFRKDA